MGVGGEFKATVFLRDDHAEETLVLDVAPGVGRQVVEFLRYLPVVYQTASLLAFVVEKGLFGRRQFRLRVAVQLLPVGRAPEQLPLPPDGAGLKGTLR